jgi:hypothetical protein
MGRQVAWINRDQGRAGGVYTVRVAEVTTGNVIHVLHKIVGGGRVFRGALAFAPDGKILAGGVKDSIHL